jgi:type VI secretion system secreted protein VgrG
MYLSDSSSNCAPLSAQATVSYSVRESGGEETIRSLHGRHVIRTGAHTHTDYNFKTPSANLTTSESTVVNVGQNDPLEIFDYPGTHTTASEGRSLSLIRMQEQEASHHLLAGTGNVRTFLSGFTFTLTYHPQTGPLNRNIDYLITEVRHMASNGGSYLGGAGGESYSNQFNCIPSSVPFRPARLSPKPLVHGPQTATVVGKSSDSSNDPDAPGSDGEEIWVDKYGRVMVLFPWDRKADCSCWMRVSQEWAGQGWGSITIPRVGQEVIVSFLEGDPDRPIITGRVYNATQTVPYTLPDNGTRSTFMTRSSEGGSSSTYNELRFEDKTGSEQVFLRAQFDQDNRVLNDSREWVGNDRSLTVTKDQMESVGGDLHAQIAGNLNQKVGQTLSLQVAQNLYETSANFAHQANQTVYISAGTTLVLEAQTELSLVVGSNFITIDATGVSITGTMVNLNSGGSAGSSGTCSPTDPVKPDEADDGSKGTKLS